MAMPKRTPKDIEKLRKERAKDPRSRYILEPRERRELVKMAGEIECLDKDKIKALSNYFVVTQGTIVQNLEGAGFDLSPLAMGGSAQKKPAPEKKQTRATLGISGKQGNPKAGVKKVDDHDAPEGMDEGQLKELRTELNLLRSQLQAQEAEIGRERRAAEEDRRSAEMLRLEAQEIMDGMDSMIEAHELEIEDLKSKSMPVPSRDPDADAIRLYTQGDLYQITARIKRELGLQIEGLMRSLGQLEEQLQHKEAEKRLEETPLEYEEPRQFEQFENGRQFDRIDRRIPDRPDRRDNPRPYHHDNTESMMVI